MLASIDSLSGGRLTIGVGVGWSQREFDALGYDFANRGARTDEIIQLLRDRVARRPVVVPRRVLRLRRDPRDAASRARHRDLGRRQQRARVPARRRARRRLPDHRRDAGGGEAGDRTHPARPTRPSVPDLVAHRMGCAGHGPGTHPRRVRRVRGGGRAARRERAVAQQPRRLVALDGPARRDRRADRATRQKSGSAGASSLGPTCLSSQRFIGLRAAPRVDDAIERGLGRQPLGRRELATRVQALAPEQLDARVVLRVAARRGLERVETGTRVVLVAVQLGERLLERRARARVGDRDRGSAPAGRA